MTAPAGADVILTANGPGEVSGWLAPVALRLRRARERQALPLRLVAWVPPCNFASGRELEMVRALGLFDAVFDPPALWRLLLWGRLPQGYTPAPRGLVLFLGGDLFYAAAAARRLGFSAMAYTEGRARWLGVFRRFFVPDPWAARKAMRMGAPADRVEVVGDLVVDAVLDSVGPRECGGGGRGGQGGDGPPVVGLFAGSRPFEVRWVLPLMLQAAEEVARAMEGRVRFRLVVSPFADRQLVRQVLQQHLPAAVRVEVEEAHQRRAMADCTVAVTVPGTVTAELAVLGVPTVTLLPLHRPELIPLEGLPGLVGRLPVVGPALKRQVVRRAARRLGPVSLPARRAGRALGPELVGRVTAAGVAGAVVELLRDGQARARLARELRQAMGPAGAADRVVGRVLEHLGMAGGASTG
ncbi:MAG TPA: hypothetical protein VIL11_03905 [Limnochordales bacterium]